RPRDVALAATAVERGGDHAFDGAASDEVAIDGLAVDHRGGLPDVARERHSGSDPVEFGEGEREIAFGGVRHPDASLPLPQSVELGAVARRDRFSVRVAVLPTDLGRKPLVVDREGGRGAGSGPLLALLGVERAPVRPLVDHRLFENEAALVAYELAALVVSREVRRPAARAPRGDDDVLGSLRGFVRVGGGWCVLHALIAPIPGRA